MEFYLVHQFWKKKYVYYNEFKKLLFFSLSIPELNELLPDLRSSSPPPLMVTQRNDYSKRFEVYRAPPHSSILSGCSSIIFGHPFSLPATKLDSNRSSTIIFPFPISPYEVFYLVFLFFFILKFLRYSLLSSSDCSKYRFIFFRE